MSNSLGSPSAFLGHLPDDQRHRVLAGMRWTLWLSALAMPFGVSVNLLLARVGPETIGVYGLLSVYAGLTGSFLYFGGDTVVMRYIPEFRPQDRASFLLSYLVVILAVMSGWLIFAWLCPTAMALAFGETYGGRIDFVLLCFSVIPISFAMVVASLKGMLEIRVSQLLTKLLTIGSLAVYALIFVFDRSLLAIYPTAIIFSVYLGLSAILGVIGAVKVVRLCGTRRLRWFLPVGFWSYAFSTQQVSVMSFLANRLDYVLIVNFGGLRLLGQYVAVTVVAATVPIVSGFFMDTLLPTLTNTVAARNFAGAAQVFTVHMRILFLVITAMGCAVMVLAVPTTHIMGPKYASLGGLIILMTAAYTIASPGTAGATLLFSIGRQQLAVWVRLLDLFLFVCLFLPLWRRWELTGAVVAFGTALVVSNVILMAVALRTARIFPSFSGLWLKAAAVQATVSFVALWWMPLSLASAALTWVGAMVLFVWLARYESSELRGLAQMFSPSFGGRLVTSIEGSVTTPAEPRVVSG